MLKLRIITASVLGTLLLLGLFLLPTAAAVLAFGAVFTVGAWEFAGFGALRSPAARALYAFAMALLMWGAWVWSRDAHHLIIVLALACLWWIAAFFWLCLAPLRRRPQLVLFCGIPVLVPAFVALGSLQWVEGAFGRGPLLVLWLILMVCAADIGAYFAGRRFGKHKLAPRVSPGKTWEGAAGGLVSVAAVALGGAAYFGLPLLCATVFGCAIGMLSIVGDLTESMFKRGADMKDSSALLPGHGGLLDRIDSVTAAAPLYALGLFGAGVIP